MPKMQKITVGLALILAASGALAQNSNNPATGNQPAAKQEGLPSIDEVLAKATKAVGGRENLDKIKTIRSVMSMDIMGSKLSMESLWSRQGGRLTKTVSDFGNVEMGTDGKTAWMLMPGDQYMLLEGEQANQVDGQASIIMGILDPKVAKDRMDKIEVVGREEFKGRMCVKVYFEPKDSQGHGHMFFDEADGLPKGVRQTEDTPMGQETSTIEVSDWKTIEGLQIFHSLKIESQSMPGGALEMKVSAIEINKAEESAFKLPEGVQKLADEAAQKDDNADTDAAPANEIRLEDLPEAMRDRTKTMVDQFKSQGKEVVARMLPQMEQQLGLLPEGQDKIILQYIIQELRKVK